MERRERRSSTAGHIGVHLTDGAAWLVRAVPSALGTPRLIGRCAVPLPAGTVSDGLVRAEGTLPVDVTDAIARFACDAPVRVALTTAGVRTFAPARGWPEHDAPGVAAVTGPGGWLLAAPRSSIERTATAVRRAGLRLESIEGGPVVLAVTALLFARRLHPPWTVRFRYDRLTIAATVSPGLWIEGGTTWTLVPGPAALEVTVDGTSAGSMPLAAAFARVPAERTAGRVTGHLIPYALAAGAALSPFVPSLGSPDLLATVLAPAEADGEAAADALPGWALESLPSSSEPRRPRASGHRPATAPGRRW